MRIVIADDHAIVRRGLQQIVASSRPGWSVVAEAGNVDELLLALRHDQPDVLVLDVSLGDRSGMDALAQVRSEFRRLPVLMLSMHPEGEYAVRSLRAGANGYMQKDSSPDEILEAIQKVASGGRYITPAVADLMAEEMVRGGSERPHERLSPREFEVFRLIARGRAVSEIAESLSLSVKTVSTYRRRILDKTGFHTNADIIGYAIRHRIV